MTDSFPYSGEERAHSPYHRLRDLLPKLAQPWWYRLVGFQYVKPDDASLLGMTVADRKRMKREARKRFKRAAKAKIATAQKRTASRRTELRAKLKIA